MKSTLISGEIVEPYAQALMSIGQANNLADAFGDDAGVLLDLLKESDDLRLFLGSPLIDPNKKKAALRQMLQEQVNPYMLNFLLLLVDRGRIVFLDGILSQYQQLLRQLRQTVLAEVTSAVELNDGQQDAIRQKVLGMTGANQVELVTRIDPDLIGGVIIKVGSQVIDASLRSQLRRIGMRLSSAS